GAQLWIEMERAIEHDEPQRRAETVAIDDDLIGVAVANEPHELMRQDIETFLELRSDAMNEIAREVPIVQRVADMDHAAEGPAQAGENHQPQYRRENHVKGQSDMDHRKAGRSNRQPHHSGDVDERGEEKCAIAPGQDEIADT